MPTSPPHDMANTNSDHRRATARAAGAPPALAFLVIPAALALIFAAPTHADDEPAPPATPAEEPTVPDEPERTDEGDGGVTATFGDDSVTVPTLWVTFASGASDAERHIEDELADCVQLAYRHSAVPRGFQVELQLRVQQQSDAGRFRDVESRDLPAPTGRGHGARTYEWTPPAAGTYRFQLVLRVTEAPRIDDALTPNPRRMEARSLWHVCAVTMAEPQRVQVVGAEATGRWVEPAGGGGRVAEVVLRVELRANEQAAFVSSAWFDFAPSADARWHALLPPPRTWQRPRDHAGRSGQVIRIERTFRLVESQWADEVALRVEWRPSADAGLRELAVVRVATGSPEAFALAGTLSRRAATAEPGASAREVPLRVTQP